MLKLLFVSGLLVVILILFAGIALGLYSRLGHPNGLVNGRLAKCPASPNCVCSEHSPDSTHFIPPIVLPDPSAEGLMGDMATIVESSGGSIVTVTDHYLAAIFRSRIFGFVDDVEFRLDPQNGILHMRSASRTGYSDGGVNRERLEDLNAQITQLLHY